MSRLVTVTAPSRLHFGLFSFGRAVGRNFGGVGVMIDALQTRVVLSEAARLEVRGMAAGRAWRFACRAVEAWALAEPPRCRIEVISAAREHIGLGSGTQLALSIAAGLNAFLSLGQMDPAELACAVGRGVRSAVGTYGFALGGMIVDGGKSDQERIAPLAARAELPAAWRFVLIRPSSGQGISGHHEQQAFATLPPVPESTSSTLEQIAMQELLPAAISANFQQFSDALYRYGRLAGVCFTARQGGPFACPRIASLVETIRTLGVQGVGQTSWGPTLYALVSDEATGRQLVQCLQRCQDTSDLVLSVAAPNARGARIEIG